MLVYLKEPLLFHRVLDCRSLSEELVRWSLYGSPIFNYGHIFSFLLNHFKLIVYYLLTVNHIHRFFWFTYSTNHCIFNLDHTRLSLFVRRWEVWTPNFISNILWNSVITAFVAEHRCGLTFHISSVLLLMLKRCDWSIHRVFVDSLNLFLGLRLALSWIWTWYIANRVKGLSFLGTVHPVSTGQIIEYIFYNDILRWHGFLLLQWLYSLLNINGAV